MEDLVQLCMACGEAVVTLNMAERGNTMLVCNLRSMAATSEARMRDEAAAATETTRTMEEELTLTSTYPRPPPYDVETFKKCLATYAYLNHALFGEQCDL